MKNYLWLIVGAGMLVALLMSFSQKTPLPVGKIGNGINDWTVMASSSAVTAGVSSIVLTATSSSRQYVSIVNDSANTVYLGFNGKAAIANSGLRLNASGGSYEITADNLYYGAISAIAPAGSSVLTFNEK